MKRALVGIAVTVAGCAMVTGGDAGTLPDLALCAQHGATHRVPAFSGGAKAYREELVRRNLLSEKEWRAIDQRGIFIGMSLCAMYAEFGRPYRENRTVTANGERIQHVYREIGASHAAYIYTTNGTVTAWQD